MIDGIAHGEGWFRLARLRDGLGRLPSRWRDWLRHVATVREVSLPDSYHVATLDHDAHRIIDESRAFIAARA